MRSEVRRFMTLSGREIDLLRDIVVTLGDGRTHAEAARSSTLDGGMARPLRWASAEPQGTIMAEPAWWGQFPGAVIPVSRAPERRHRWAHAGSAAWHIAA